MHGIKHFFRLGFGPSSSHTIAPGLAMDGFLEELENIMMKQDLIKSRSDILDHIGSMNATFSGLSFYDTGVGHKSPHALELSLNDFFENDFKWVMKKDLSKDEKEFDIKCYARHTEYSEPFLRMNVLFSVPPPEFLTIATEEEKLHPSVKNLNNGLIFEAFTHSQEPILSMAGYSVGGGQFCWVTLQGDDDDNIHFVGVDEPFRSQYYPDPIYPPHLTTLEDIRDHCIDQNITFNEFVELYETPEDVSWLTEVLLKRMKKSIRKGYDSVDIKNAYFDVHQKVRRRAYAIRKEVVNLFNPSDDLLTVTTTPSSEKIDVNYSGKEEDRKTEKARKMSERNQTRSELRNSYWSSCVVFPAAVAVMETNTVGASPGGEKVCTAPTCGSCGVLPSVLSTSGELGLATEEEEFKKALEVAFLIGNLAKINGSLSGAEAGCAAEIGVATAMASAAYASIIFDNNIRLNSYESQNDDDDGNNLKDENHLEKDRLGVICGAAAIGLRLATSLTCDISIHGEVTIPCMERNSMYASQAIFAAELMNDIILPNYKNNNSLKTTSSSSPSSRHHDPSMKDFSLFTSKYCEEFLMSGKGYDDAVLIMHRIGKTLPEGYRESSGGPLGRVLDPGYGKREIYPMKAMKSIRHNFLIGPGPSSMCCTSLYRGIIECLENCEKDFQLGSRKNDEDEVSLVYRFLMTCPKHDQCYKDMVNARNLAIRDLEMDRHKIVDRIDFEFVDKKYFIIEQQQQKEDSSDQKLSSDLSLDEDDVRENQKYFVTCTIEVYSDHKTTTSSSKQEKKKKKSTKPSRIIKFECFSDGHYDIVFDTLIEKKNVGNCKNDSHEGDEKNRRNLMYSKDVYTQHCTLSEIEKWCIENSKDISSYVIDHESKDEDVQSANEVVSSLEDVWDCMITSIKNGLKKNHHQEENEAVDHNKLISSYGHKNMLSLYAMAVMRETADGDGVIVSTPFGNLGCGIIPAVISSSVESVVGMNILEIDELWKSYSNESASFLDSNEEDEESSLGQHRVMQKVIEAHHLIIRGLAVAGLMGNLLKIANVKSSGLSDLTLNAACAAASAAHIRKCNSIRAISQAAEIVIEHSLGQVFCGKGRERPGEEGGLQGGEFGEARYSLVENLALENAAMARKAIDAAKYSHLTNHYAELSLEQILWVLDRTNRDMLRNMRDRKLIEMDEDDFYDNTSNRMVSVKEYFESEWDKELDVLLDFWWK